MTPDQTDITSATITATTGIRGKIIGISISESADLQELGFGDVHLQDAEIEFARYLLAGGARLAYGGDLRKNGFTDNLFQLVAQHNKSGLKPFECIESYLSWPLHLSLTPAQIAEYNQTAKFHAVPPPAFLNITDPKTYIKPNTTDNRDIWAHCLTAMREKINANVDARLLLGGKVQGYTGKYPGLLEEACMALRDEKPTYLIGGFGGCARAVIRALKGETPEAFTEAFQFEDGIYSEMVKIYNRNDAALPAGEWEPIDYAGKVTFLNVKGVGALNNGLSDEENERLFCTVHIPEMVALVLKGLRNI